MPHDADDAAKQDSSAGSRVDRFAARPYDLRHAAVSLWPNGGVAGGAERDLAKAVQADVVLEASGAPTQDAGPSV